MGVDCQDAVDSPGSEKVGIGRDQIPFVPVVNGEIEIAFPDEKISNAAQHLRVVSLAKLRQQDPDCLHALSLEGTGDHAGAVVEFGGSGLDAITRGGWNGGLDESFRT